MIHRALLGSMERFIGVLIEHYAGKFPVWLAPVQLILINVGEDVREYTEKLEKQLLVEGIRVESDLREETIGYKIREAISKKVPYIGVIGRKESEEGTISIRKRGEKDSTAIKTDEFLNIINKEIKNRI